MVLGSKPKDLYMPGMYFCHLSHVLSTVLRYLGVLVLLV